jgi:UBX domain-containing protein 7
MDDDAVAQVVMVTNTTTEKAIQYLTLADGHPDQAITLFFENGGADLVGGPSSSHPSSTHPAALTHSDRRGDARNPIDVDDDDAFNDDNPQFTGSRPAAHLANRESTPSQAESTFEDDAAMARRLQEEMYGSPGSGGMGGEDTIRAPIARQSETLLGPGASSGGYADADIPAAIEERMRDLQRRRMPGE